MSNPKIKLNSCTYAQITQNKSGDLAMVYKPLLNFVKEGGLGDFTTEHLNFDRYTSLDMLIVDEFDGSTNIIINDDKNLPRLINSGFAVLEDNTFLIPEHYTNTVNNLYEDEIFDLDTLLFKLYNVIPELTFDGLDEGGAFKCGSYTFYFRLADNYGNMSNIIQHSSIVLVPIGSLKSYKLRMGMLDEATDKAVKFTLTNLDGGFDYVRVFYERTSTANDQAQTTLFYMIDQNFPIIDGKCVLRLTGEESTIGIDLPDLKNEYADIATCKTHTIVDNTLFMGNVSAFHHDYKQLLKLAWCIYPTQESEHMFLPQYSQLENKQQTIEGFYKPENVYYNVGYWPDEYYRFGIVFIYNNNLLSPVFNILGYDLAALLDLAKLKDLLFNKSNRGTNEFFDAEPDNYIFKEEILSNSKGVVHLKPSDDYISTYDTGNLGMYQLYIKFNFEGLGKWFESSQDLTDADRAKYKNINSYLQQYHGIKGFFFVRQKRIPSNLAQGIVVGLTTKDHGSIPILKNGNNWETKSFLSKERLILPIGRTVTVIDSPDYDKVVTKALLVPDAELLEFTFNSLFTSAEYAVVKEGTLSFDVYKDDIWRVKGFTKVDNAEAKKVKLTAVPKDTILKTNGEDYFSSVAGSPAESYKTEDVNFRWNKTKPQDLTTSDSLIRGRWGYYVGMGYDESVNFNFGDVVTIKKAGFADENSDQNRLEFISRFSDYSFYSPVSTRYNIGDIDISKGIDCFNGDCFSSMFTHRMMSNFIDPELPTNTKIVDPSCWAKNYAVRCTAEIISKTHSNLTSDSAGFWIESPHDKKSAIVSLVFGLLTGNLGILIKSAKELDDINSGTSSLIPPQLEFANEVAQAFEIYTGIPSSSSEAWSLELDDPISSGGYLSYDIKSDSSEKTVSALETAVRENKIKIVQPTELEKDSAGLNLKALFKSDDKWEMHGIALINRADVNAVSFGQWIMFPVRSSLNLALRDVDFNLTTEEAKFNKKRSFFPLEDMDIANKLPESNVINGAAKKTVHKNSYPAYKTVPFLKLEYFNRIYWSKPNVSESFLNSFRMVYSNQYKEYNKEFGDITKLLPVGNYLFVCFDHGMGIIPVDRSSKTAADASPYLASRNVLPSLVQTLNKDFGSMWKNSVILTPKGIIYGVDTVAKKIWRTTGQQVEIISDHVVTKFLNDWMKLSEFDYKAYLGHVDVKTHYNNFKNDVIFTFVKDIPIYSSKIQSKDLIYYIQQLYCASAYHKVVLGKYDLDSKTIPFAFGDFSTYEDSNIDLLLGYTNVLHEGTNTVFTCADGTVRTVNNKLTIDKKADVQLGKIYINDLFTGVRLDVESWIPGVKWSLCFNEAINKFVTFYDWYPVESCNVDNIYFSFDLDNIDNVYEDKLSFDCVPLDTWGVESIQSNKFFIDEAFSDIITIYRLPNTIRKTLTSDKKFISCYYKGNLLVTNISNKISIPLKDEWNFMFAELNGSPQLVSKGVDIAELKCFNIPNVDKYIDSQIKLPDSDPLRFYDIRDYNPNRMYLWKHGLAGIYDNEGKILPTHWYGKQHEFNFEFVVQDLAPLQKIFNNLKMVSNKARPHKFEYEIVGEGYDWWPYKEVVYWANEHVTDSKSLEDVYKEILTKTVSELRNDYPDFPSTFVEERSTADKFIYKKLPYLEIELTDRKGRLDKSYNPKDKWDSNRTDTSKKYDHAFNTTETVIKYDELLNEYRIHDEQLGNDMWKYGRVRGNMLYLEDYWNIEIRPLNFVWKYIDKNGNLLQKAISETRHRDKYIKIKVRYSGEDLAIIQMIHTMFEQSFA